MSLECLLDNMNNDKCVYMKNYDFMTCKHLKCECIKEISNMMALYSAEVLWTFVNKDSACLICSYDF